MSGTPTLPGTYPVTILVQDSTQSDAKGTAFFNIHVTGPVAILTPVILPNGVANQNYSFQFQAAGGSGSPYSWTLASGGAGVNSLPKGLSLAANGILSGTPTSAGSFGFDITVTDSSNGTITAHFELTIAQPMLITTPSPLTTGSVNTGYSQQIAVTGGNPPYTFALVDPANAPQGMSITSSGVLGGLLRSTGTFSFSIRAMDQLQYTATKQFQLVVAPAGALLQTSLRSLTFSANAGGDAPPPQAIPITAPGGTPVNFVITMDGGSSGGAAPSWITVTPSNGPAPAAAVVSVNHANLQPGKYSAGIHVSVPGNTSQTPIDIPVTLNVAAASTPLAAVPASLKFAARAVTPLAQDQFIVLTNPGGGGPVNFSTSVVGKSSWISALTPATGRVAANAPAAIRVFINTQGLKVGFYRDAIRVTTTAGTVDVPVSLFVSDEGPVIGLSSSGLRFQIRQGAGSTETQSVNVFDLGDSNTSSEWQAELLSGSDWLVLGTPNGVSTPIHSATMNLVLGPGANSLAPGGHYALVRISDPNAINSPQYLVAVLDVAAANSPALPDPSPAGLFFTTGSAPQTVSVYTSSTDPVGFQTTTYTSDGAAWLSATPGFGTASTSSPGKVTVAISTASLAAGIYYGTVNISMNGALRSVGVTLVVLPNSTCTPSKVAIVQTALPNNFAIPTTWPAPVSVQVNDDCGNAVSTATVIASFSNGDPPLLLRGDSVGNVYSASWQPSAAAPSATITIRATQANLNSATLQYAGAVTQNPSSPPTLIPNGALHIFFDNTMAATLGSALAPGNVAQVYGTGMASTPSQTTVPLPDTFNGTYMLIGAAKAPLFYVSNQLLDVQVPFELTPYRQYQILVSANGALTMPSSIDVIPFQPGVAQFPDGTVIAQISGTTNLISATNPAKPGQSLTIYLAGMGPTNPSVATGQPAPAQALPVTNQPTVTLDGQNVAIQYAGLTPTGVGLYQINFTVPSNARSGNLDLAISQSGVAANTTKLPVSN